MGTRGPVPQREDQTIRRNKPDIPVTKIPTYGPVNAPDLGIPGAHQLVVDMYESLKDSAQSHYYEPSDWQYARVTMYLINDMLKGKGDDRRVSPMMVSSVSSMMTALLMTEGDRRRVRIEIERSPVSDVGGKVLEVADLFRQRFAEQARPPGES